MDATYEARRAAAAARAAALRDAEVAREAAAAADAAAAGVAAAAHEEEPDEAELLRLRDLQVWARGLRPTNSRGYARGRPRTQQRGPFCPSLLSIVEPARPL